MKAVSPRTILFQIHWFLGISAGLVLAAMGVTGAAISWQSEMLAALNPGVVSVTVGPERLLRPEALLARIAVQRPGVAIRRLQIEDDPGLAAQVSFQARGRGRNETSYVDPRSGRLLGTARGAGIFETIEHLHRWLALPGGGKGWGRQITGVAALALIYFALSGLYLRWPRHPLRWRGWFDLDLRRTGANLFRSLHVVIGTILLPLYVLSALTGLWWSYQWYQEGARYVLTGSAKDPNEARPERGMAGGGVERGRAGKPKPSLAVAWPAFRAVADEDRYRTTSALIAGPGAAVRFRGILRGARHERVADEYLIDGVTGRVIRADPYARRPLGQSLALSMYELHRGAFFGTAGRVAFMLSSLAMPLFTVTGLLLYVGRRRKKRRLRGLPGVSAPVSAGMPSPLVVYASQGGRARRIAERTAAAFPDARLRSLSSLTPEALAAERSALFIVSTYADGDPPDGARRFAERVMVRPHPLGGLDYAMLALGDREYPDFCRFGEDVDRWLAASGARRTATSILADGDDHTAERTWFQQIAAGGGLSVDAAIPVWHDWRLVERTLLNEGSAGEPVYHVRLAPCDAPAEWAPGDIAEILPRQDDTRIDRFLAALDRPAGPALRESLADRELECPDQDIAQLPPLRHRDYSIASVTASGAIDLVVRRNRRDDGTIGVASAWLTAGCVPGDTMRLRIRSNPGFNLADDRAPLVLIGNGTGIAGLLAHIRHRARDGGGRAWLLFGERSAAHDALFDAELAGHLDAGTLARLDRCWSRDEPVGTYVQALIPRVANDLRVWIASGAVILVCGSLQGMAPAVDAALRAELGDKLVDDLIDQKRYLRDIY